MIRLVLDTNIIISAFSRKSQYRMVLDRLLAGSYQLCVSNDIMLEYEEKLKEKFNEEVAEIFVATIELLPNAVKVDPHYQFQLIKADPDDNKFVDCAIAANASYLVSNDKHFRILRDIPFPQVQLLSMTELVNLLSNVG